MLVSVLCVTDLSEKVGGSVRFDEVHQFVKAAVEGNSPDGVKVEHIRLSRSANLHGLLKNLFIHGTPPSDVRPAKRNFR